MSPLRLFLFDDALARGWAPFTLTRPAGELLFGSRTLRERAERAFGARCEAHLSRSALLGFDEPGAPPVCAADELGTGGTRVLLSSRAVVEPVEAEPPDDFARLSVGGEPAGWVLPDGAPFPPREWLREPATATGGGPVLELRGEMLPRPWDLVARNTERLRRDLEEETFEESEPAGAFRIGGGAVSLAEGAEIEPGVHVDTRGGPVRLEAGARVEGPARLIGPLFVGAGTRVLGGHVGTSSIGPVCNVRGEVADSVLLGYANKAHDGYVGHALLGRWVNLGAFTTNSDLKNNYRSVRVWTLEGEVDTGMLKVGCFLGDHVKTGIGTMLGTGTVIGAGSNVFGAVMPPPVVPPFSWGAGDDLRDYRLEELLRTAERVMARRDQALTPGARRILERAWQDTAGRRAALS